MKISKDYVGLYELEVARNGCCKGLAGITFIQEDDCYIVQFAETEAVGINAVFNPKDNVMFDAYRILLSFMRAVCKSAAEAEEYLIPSSHLSFSANSLMLKNNNVLLQFCGKPQSFEKSISSLLNELSEQFPFMHAGFLADQLPETYDARQLNRILLGYEMDLKYL